MIRSVLYFEFLHDLNIFKYFNRLNFDLAGTFYASDGSLKQDWIRSNKANFLLTSHCSPEKSSKPSNDSLNTLGLIKSKNETLFNRINQQGNTVFNMALSVTSIDSILEKCRLHNTNIIKEKHQIKDSFSSKGYLEMAVIESCVNGLVHTLYESSYDELPHVHLNDSSSSQPKYITHFDHITIATHKDTTNELIDWYSKIFQTKRILINKFDCDEKGLEVQTGKTGLFLKAVGFQDVASEFKMVFVEPFDYIEKNQITTFLEENNGSGVQHIALSTDEIVKTIEMTKRDDKIIDYYVPPKEYYKNEKKLNEIKNCNMNEVALQNNHILIEGQTESSSCGNGEHKDFIMQIFTQPLFNKNTFFLEYIQRVGKATGFGGSNIKALWEAVQLSIFKDNIKN